MRHFIGVMIALFSVVFCANAEFTPLPPEQIVFPEVYAKLCRLSEGMFTLMPMPCNAIPLWRPYCSFEYGDINGPFDTENEEHDGNGMTDYYELSLLTAIFNKPSGWSVSGPLGQGVDRESLLAAWALNEVRLSQDMEAAAGDILDGMEIGGMLHPTKMTALYAIAGAYLIMGGEGNFSVAQHSLLKGFFCIRDIPLDAANYVSFPQFLTPTGDADMDGFTNREELDGIHHVTHQLPTTEAYTAAVLDPSMVPSGAKVDSDTDGLKDVEEDKNLNKAVDDGETDPFNADTDGDGLSDGAEVQWGSDPLSAESKAEVPAVSAGALALLGIALGGLGARRMRRK